MSKLPPQIHLMIGLSTQETSLKSSDPEMRLIVTAKDSGVWMAVRANMKTVWRLKTEPNSLVRTSLVTRARLGRDRTRLRNKTRRNISQYSYLSLLSQQRAD